MTERKRRRPSAPDSARRGKRGPNRPLHDPAPVRAIGSIRLGLTCRCGREHTVTATLLDRWWRCPCGAEYTTSLEGRIRTP